MDLPQEADDYILGSIQHSLALPVPDDTLRLKLLASEEARHRLQDRIFLLEDLLKGTDSRLEQYKAEATMSAQALRRCIEEKEVMNSRYADLANKCAKLERECVLYDRDIERLMESCDELGRENEELRARLKDASDVMALVAEIESLQKDKEHLRINLHRAEEEVKVLYEENNILDRENKKLLKHLNKERQLGSGGKHSGSAASKQSLSASAKGKRKSSLKENSTIEKAIDFNGADSPRQPLSPLQQNSPNSRRHKK